MGRTFDQVKHEYSSRRPISSFFSREGDLASGTSSPLTSLSSLEEEEDHRISNSARVHREIDEISAAQV